MKREFLKTGDGSITIRLPEWNEQYHSKHGAIAESSHVFILSGLQHFLDKENQAEVDIMEIGFGTGLNAFLTLIFSRENGLDIKYTGIEAYPVPSEELQMLNYHELTSRPELEFHKLHEADWETTQVIDQGFQLTKLKKTIESVEVKDAYHLIYFDAFGPRVQPELWTESVFSSMYAALKPGGVLVTYSAKGSVRRAMIASGFSVERLPGPPGKREMLRATK